MAVAQNRFGRKGEFNQQVIVPSSTIEEENFRYGIKDNKVDQTFVAEDDAGSFVEEEAPAFFTPKGVELSQGPMRFGKAVSEGDLKDANENFIAEEQLDFFSGRDKELYANYDKVYTEYEEAGDIAGMDSATDEYQAMLDTQNEFFDTYACSFAGQCSETSKNIVTDLSEQWTVDDLKLNKVLIASLQRTNGAYKRDGTVKNAGDLLSEWAADQQWFEYNFANKALQSSKFWIGLSDEQKLDTALQWTSFQKVKGKEADGGLNSAESWKNIGLALAADPTNYVGYGLLRNIWVAGSKLAGKKTGQAVVKKGIQKYLAGRTKTKAAATGALIGLGFAGADEVSGQQVLKQAGLQDGYDWSKVLTTSLIGATAGTALGFGLAGGGEILTKVANNYILKNNLTNQAFLDEMSKAVTDEKSLKKWLAKLGWNKPAIKEEVDILRKAGDTDAGPTVPYKAPAEARNTEAYIIGDESQVQFKVDADNVLSEKEIIKLKKVAAQKIIPDEEITGNQQIYKNAEIRRAQKQLDDVDEYNAITYAQADTLAIQAPFTQWGYNTFNKVSEILGKGVTRAVYGNDTLLTNSGARGLGESMFGAHVTTDINVARFTNDIQTFATKHAEELGDINKLIDIGVTKNTTKIQGEFLNIIKVRKNKVLNDAYKAKVITKKQLDEYKADKAYVPRVWDSANLMTKEGSDAFSKFLSVQLKKNPADTKKLLDSITGDSKISAELINANMAPQSVRNMFQRKSLERTDIKRSSHLENERRFVLPARMERELDEFMAPATDRWASFFSDTIRRNEYAKRFGANDEKVVKFVKELRKKGKNRQADDVEEVYYTAIGDGSKSLTIQAAMNSPKLARAISKINAVQNHKLGLAAIPNATQSFVNGTVMLAKSGNLITAPFKAISSIARAIVRTKKDLEIINRSGVLGDMDLARIATENAPSARIIDKQFKGPLKILNEPTEFLRATGFMSVERMNRRAGAIMSFGHVNTLHTKLQRLVLDGQANSVKGIKLQRELKELGVNDPTKAALTEQDYAISGHMFNKHINFSGESVNLPVSWHKPWFKLMTKFKSFMFYQARFLKRNVSDELFIHGNAKPLALYLVAGGLAGNAAEVTRALASGKDIEQNRNALELLIDGVGNAGAWGLWFDTMQDISERGSGALATVAGPTVSDAFDTLQDISKGDLDKILLRLVPNVPGKGQLQETFRNQ